jgi:hypothetical protein
MSKGIIYRLKTDTDVTSQLSEAGDSIMAVRESQGAVKPYIVVNSRIDDPFDNYDDQTMTAYVTEVVVVSDLVYTEGADIGAKELADVVRQSLHNLTGTYNNEIIREVVFQDEEEPMPIHISEERREYEIMQTYRVFVERVLTPKTEITNAVYSNNDQSLTSGDTMTAMAITLTPAPATATYSVVSGSLPTNASLNATTGEITQSSAASADIYAWTVKVTGYGAYSGELFVQCTLEVVSASVVILPKVVRFWGQSNMNGFTTSPLTHLPAEYTGEFENVKVWNGTSCENLNTATNNNQFPVSSRNSSFASEIVAAIDVATETGGVVYIHKYAIGSTGLYIIAGTGNDYNVYNNDLWPTLRSDLIAFEAWLDANVGTREELGLVCQQGEQEAIGGATEAAAWATNFADFIREYRSVTSKDLSVHIVHIHNSITSTHKAIVRESQEQVVQGDVGAVGNITGMSIDLLQSDVLHVDSQTQIETGHRLVPRLLNRNYTPSAKTSSEFKVIHGTSVFTGTSITLTEGVDYTLPVGCDATNSWFEVSNTRSCLNGRNNIGTTVQLKYLGSTISGDIATSITITAPSVLAAMRLDWKIICYTGSGNNDVVVRAYGSLSGSGVLAQETGVISGVVDASKVVVLITGQSTSSANSGSLWTEALWTAKFEDGKAKFDRLGLAGSGTNKVSYVVLEFTGSNWSVLREEFTTTGSVWAKNTRTGFTVNTTSFNKDETFLVTQYATDNDASASNDVSGFGAGVVISDDGVLKVYNRVNTGVQRKVCWLISNPEVTVQHIDWMFDQANMPEELQFLAFIKSVYKESTSVWLSASTSGTASPCGALGYIIYNENFIRISSSESAQDRRICGSVVELP